MKKLLLLLILLAQSANANHAWTCEAKGRNAAYGIGSSYSYATAHNLALAYCNSYNNGNEGCVVTRCW